MQLRLDKRVHGFKVRKSFLRITPSPIIRASVQTFIYNSFFSKFSVTVTIVWAAVRCSSSLTSIDVNPGLPAYLTCASVLVSSV